MADGHDQRAVPADERHRHEELPPRAEPQPEDHGHRQEQYHQVQQQVPDGVDQVRHPELDAVARLLVVPELGDGRALEYDCRGRDEDLRNPSAVAFHVSGCGVDAGGWNARRR